jgi:hypothetical protein
MQVIRGLPLPAVPSELLALVKTGKVYSLSVLFTLTCRTPQRSPFRDAAVIVTRILLSTDRSAKRLKYSLCLHRYAAEALCHLREDRRSRSLYGGVLARDAESEADLENLAWAMPADHHQRRLLDIAHIKGQDVLRIVMASP